jgi:DNA-binding transcriptional ArsR family regulator
VTPRNHARKKDLEQAVAHEFRCRALELFEGGSKSLSPSTAGRTLDEPVANASYHFKVLIRAGLIELERSRPVRGAVEHIYKADPELLDHPVVRSALEKRVEG